MAKHIGPGATNSSLAMFSQSPPLVILIRRISHVKGDFTTLMHTSSSSVLVIFCVLSNCNSHIGCWLMHCKTAAFAYANGLCIAGLSNIVWLAKVVYLASVCWVDISR